MFEEILKDEAHPYHPCACAIQAVTDARDARLETVLGTLSADRGRVRSIKWGTDSDPGDDGVPIVSVEDIALVLEDLSEVHFGRTLLLDQMDEQGDEPMHGNEYVIGLDEEVDDVQAELQLRLSRITGIDPARLTGWLWLANNHIWQVHEDQSELVLDRGSG